MTAAFTAGLDQIIAQSHHLLLDFDGPVCTVFASIPSYTVAEELRTVLQASGVSTPGPVRETTDPLEVFGLVAGYDPDAAPLAQRELARLELQAIAGAKPTESAAELITVARKTNRTATIVTNNSSRAAHTYLNDHGLTGCIAAVVGRDDADPDRLKPSPYRVREAVGMLGAEGESAPSSAIR